MSRARHIVCSSARGLMKSKALGGLALALLTIGGCRACTDYTDRQYVECETIEPECEGARVVTCEDGLWSDPVACEDGTTCVDGACIRPCDLPGERRCQGDKAEQCVEGRWEVQATCDETTTCVDGACIRPCDLPGERRCQGDTPEQCVEGQWQVEASCSSPRPVCEAGDCKQALMPLPETSGYDHTCVVGSAGGVYCWGRNGQAQLGVVGAAGTLPLRVPGLPSDIVEVALGWYHTCARTSGGDLWCWGNNGYGQLGPIGGGLLDKPPTKVPGIPKVRLVRAAHERTCVLDTKGSVWCFGNNDAGEISIPPDGANHPTLVPELEGAEDLAMGTDLTCGVRGDGTAICMGDEQSPPEIPLDDIVELRMNDYHQCAIREGQLVACWGADTFGGLGNGPPAENLSVPETLALRSVDDVAVGWLHTCVLAEGVVSCVGNAAKGQLGNGTTADTTFDFADALLPSAALDITSSFGTVCAAIGPRDLYCWGENEVDGGVGDGTTLNQPTPVRIDWDAADD